MSKSQDLKLKSESIFKPKPNFKGSKFSGGGGSIFGKSKQGGFDPGRFKTQHKG